MPHFDTPEPVQNHPVTLTPPSLRNLSGWGWLALAVVVVSSRLPLYFGQFRDAAAPIFSQNESYEEGVALNQITLQSTNIPRHVYGARKGPSPAPPPPPRAPYSNIPHLAVPSPAMSPLAKKRTTPMYDTHNIRFASPSNAAIYNNPKLAPVQGSAVPLSYDSHDNLFANPFTPAPAPRDTSYRGHWAFRRNDKGKSRSGGKENLSGAELEEMPMKRLF
ncbi:hypothetical protein B0H10DRAFT_2227343 [Mycena sp. CBHHK59/15]|nr:hypothetical protein B0H10DRAFT_2227343 [Mycena sp. CBHHK59/15]